ncbi:hypothetical protein RHMOL_Rhmol05G0006200 [Rhododendron molle]|uniref:Uncharacterized protein n=1 Tax=Rhododendron molle TaxID=49168 RepID=A0ACC0NKP6_RHOML|nr:hypothetical protein RHMOL_Rhmol05G0006200 [Rhododendron molle]
MSWQSSAVSFLHGKSSLVMKVSMLLTKILKLDKRPIKLKESDTKREEGKREKIEIPDGRINGRNSGILLHLKKPNFWDGALLVAPMCKVCCLPG